MLYNNNIPKFYEAYIVKKTKKKNKGERGNENKLHSGRKVWLCIMGCTNSEAQVSDMCVMTEIAVFVTKECIA